MRDKQMEANASELLHCAHISCFAIFVHPKIYGSLLCKLCTIDWLGNGRTWSSVMDKTWQRIQYACTTFR